MSTKFAYDTYILCNAGHTTFLYCFKESPRLFNEAGNLYSLMRDLNLKTILYQVPKNTLSLILEY